MITLLHRIIQEEALEAKHGANASKLRQQYIKVNAKYKKGQMVKFIKPYLDIVVNGKIFMIKFSTSPFGIIYIINICRKDGGLSKSDPSHYYIKEKDIITK